MNAKLMAAAIILLFSCQSVRSENIAFNPGFEMEGPGGVNDSAGWLIGGTPTSERSLTMQASGLASHRLFDVPNTNGDTAVVQFDNETSLAENSELFISFDASVTAAEFHGGVVIFRVTDALGNIIFPPRIEFPFTNTNGVFQHFVTPTITIPEFGPAPLDKYFWDVRFLALPRSSGQPVEIFLDNVVIDATLVPEPRVTLLPVTLGVLICSFRKKQGNMVIYRDSSMLN